MLVTYKTNYQSCAISIAQPHAADIRMPSNARKNPCQDMLSQLSGPGVSVSEGTHLCNQCLLSETAICCQNQVPSALQRVINIMIFRVVSQPYLQVD